MPLTTHAAAYLWGHIADYEKRGEVKKVVKDALIALAVTFAEATSVRDLDSDQRDSLNEVLETVGLEPITYRYKARVTVSITVEVEIAVDGSSEESAQEAIENDHFEGELHDEIVQAVSDQSYTIESINVSDIQESE